MPTPPENLKQFSSLVQLISDLRGPDGCPWDKEQNHQTLLPYAIEETFEMVDAIESQIDQDICEELGDVLFQVVLHASLAEERKAFTINDVILSINEKLVRRHPHVFAGLKVKDTQEVLTNWELVKKQEKINKPKPPLFNSPKGLPALQTADKIGDKTKKYQFDWENATQVLAQLKSEIVELEEAMLHGDPSHIQHELGDVLFTAAQLGRHLQIDSEAVLRQANTRFIRRFNGMLQLCGNDLEKFKNLSTSEKEDLWKKIKIKK